MAETLCSIMGGRSGGSDTMGFTAIPEGNWEFKSSKTSTWPGFSSSVIPICQTITCSATATGNWPSISWASASTSINGTAALTAAGGTRWNESFSGHSHVVRVGGDATAYSVFLPWFYNMNLTTVQQNVTNGTITVWLQKVE